MRSLLFVPADGGAKLDKAMASGADAVILDLEDSITPERKDIARKAALDFLKSAQGQTDRPRLLVRVNGLDTGMTDADLDAVVAGKPDAIMFPKAEGGATVTHLDAKLTAREAIAGVAEGHIKILAQSVETALGVFTAGTYRNSSARLIGMTWGPEDLSAEIGARANRDADGQLTEPYRLARSICLLRRDRGEGSGQRDHPRRFPQSRRAAPGHRRGAPRRLCRTARHSSGAGAGDQRRVHAGRRRDRKGQGRGRGLCRQARRRHRRHRRQDVRPAASAARAAAARQREDVKRGYFFSYTAFGSNVFSSRNCSITLPAGPSGTAR